MQPSLLEIKLFFLEDGTASIVLMTCGSLTQVSNKPEGTGVVAS